MDKWVVCYEIDVYRLVLFSILHVQNVIRFCVMVSMQNYRDRNETDKMNPFKRKPMSKIPTGCTVVVPCYVSFDTSEAPFIFFHWDECGVEKRKKVQWLRHIVETLLDYSQRCDLSVVEIYIFFQTIELPLLEQHCWCNENVFRSHLYSCVVAILSSSLPLIPGLYLL